MDLICGINPVLEALAAGTRHFDRLVVVKGMRNRRIEEVTARGSRLGIPLRFEAREALDRMAGGVPHQGIIAVVSAKALQSLEEITATMKQPPLLVLLDGVEDPRNLGAILRTCEAAGVDGVLLPERHSAGLSESVARTSAGAVEHVRVARIGNVAQAIDTLKEKGMWIVGFDAQGSERWDAIDFQRPIVIVLGGEARGIRRLVREKCDHVSALPLFGHVTSLNVSVVAGVALYEAIRQRKSVPSHVKPIPVGAARTPSIVGPGPDDLDDELAPIPRNGEGGEDENETPGSSVRFDDLDSVAWSLRPAPQAPDSSWNERRQLIPAGGGRDRSQGDRGRRKRRRGRPPQGAAPSTPQPPREPREAAPAAEGQPAGTGVGPSPQGRRRRRRRRPRPQAGGQPGS
jgi:23S rRNA (guanosine2251-2'-O)-methyltransferase